MTSIKNVYFIGIGGMGMASIAGIMLERGFHVYGSDIKKSCLVEKLIEKGAIVNFTQSSNNILQDIDVVVYSSAISDSNPEIVETKRRGITLLHRSEMLSYLLKSKNVVTVAGSHGKTTTTTLVGSILKSANRLDTLSVGGIWDQISSNYYVSDGDISVIEADESDGTFLNFTPFIAVITNIDYEHVDFYDSLEKEISYYKKFVGKVPEKGRIVLCDDSPNCTLLKEQISNVFSYGINNESDLIATNITISSDFTCFDVSRKNNNGTYDALGNIKTSKHGYHNVRNCLAAICVGLTLDIDFEEIREGIYCAGNVDRRMQVMAKGNYLGKNNCNNVILMNDYAHHPTEIKATLETIKQTYADRRIITIFQPHRYSRTKAFLPDFAKTLSLSDYLIFTDIYGAFEEGNDVKSMNLVEELERICYKSYVYSPDNNSIEQELKKVIQTNDIVLILGAGNINDFGNKLKDEIV